MKYLRSYLYTLSINQSCHRQNLLFQRVLVFSQTQRFFFFHLAILFYGISIPLVNNRYAIFRFIVFFFTTRTRRVLRIYIYSFCKVKGKCRIKKKKKETKETNCIDTWLIFPSIMGKRIREWQEIQVIRGEWWTSGLVIQPRIIMQSFSRIFVANAKYIRAQIMQ